MSDQRNTEGDRDKENQENEEAKQQIIDKPSQAEGDEGDSDQG